MATEKFKIEMEVEAEVGQLFSPIGVAKESDKVENYITELIMHDGEVHLNEIKATKVKPKVMPHRPEASILGS